MREAFSWEAFNKMPLVGILRNMPTESLEEIAKCMIKAGISTMEITFNSPGALASIRKMVDTYGDRLNIGAGTVCNLNEMHQALDAGAQFIVMPISDDDVVNYCVIHKIPVFPGAYTPTEIYRAWQMGATMVKVFPAGTLGPTYIKDVLAPLNEIKLMPTGGVTLENLGDYFKAGASGVGLGTGLTPKNLVLEKDWKGLEKLMSNFVRMYNKVTL
ncbi:4-hydroxy-2-oxoglutarate aldolase / 2-dehydro-3-deoxyphosphogluconate aldolase [Lunatimonas lonarensis]|uniref:4-hydroxy-2-oxoglutarate aldolase / 2-dehydro-3-deoxyphosphogluconate aldolase n=1 Tax=Lunatimonas lonarensis TaxID=1232681 RepID=R7ZRW3_9BACT|nr:bifunctional 4-hydroxy-2-oxoglutarate aldolase/2-dehydro-3-deoxy-phosphogluconate aldolase [Lunatimonas lonarensis]EON76734.1 4-hydroxy-2-oxoglutarate aldolase / 2-dehydro-3-deoxyphosphogluconate aldolase [Lunatimonas lonarensis]